jgi:hypothetical protein
MKNEYFLTRFNSLEQIIVEMVKKKSLLLVNIQQTKRDPITNEFNDKGKYLC